MDMSKALCKHLAALGKKGGEAGKGDAKRRGPAHYKRIAKLAVEARRAKRDGGNVIDRALTQREKVAESNRIEGILHEPTDAELTEFERFLHLERVTIGELQRFVDVYQPGAQLRYRSGLDVRVGAYEPPLGGQGVLYALDNLLAQANDPTSDPWNVHVDYERIHPFTDGNGRSGRMLWYWQMGPHPQAALGFLHCFYYQTLRGARRD